MSTSRAARLCLACLLLWVPAPGLAVTVDVEIEGLSGEAFDNVRASLSILRRGNPRVPSNSPYIFEVALVICLDA